MLRVVDLHTDCQTSCILKNVSLSIEPGTVHVLMGPNGSGKSTFARTIIGDPRLVVKKGSLFFDGVDITNLKPDERAHLGIFLAFQHPCAIPGLTVFSFLKEAYGACTGKVITVDQFRQLLYDAMSLLGIDHSFAFRSVNDGFSGGEKKRLEVLQLLILNPRLAILDEIDSGLDVDALQVVARGIMHARAKNPDMALLVITHRQHILQQIQPDHVHIFCNGTIVYSGGPELAARVEREGYDAFM